MDGVLEAITSRVPPAVGSHLDRQFSADESAFIGGRLISDNVLTAFEMFHFMKNKRHGKEGCFALKLDMSKAYDCVEWESTVEFRPTRGLRQGDPLSPYLFVLCVEGLSALITRAETSHRLTGMAICRGGPRISHLFFADDSLLFGVAKPEEILVIQGLLLEYEGASGQKINLDKSTIFFSANVDAGRKEALRQILNVGSMVESGKYLGLPYLLGRSKKEVFTFIKDRVWKRISSWKEKFLSVTGREVMIKAVIQSIPTYVMSCFQLPTTFCAKIDSMVCRYWWGPSGNKRKIHWTSWEALCHPKWEGGMGFRRLANFNSAMLAKQGWRLLTSHDSLFARLMQAKYYPSSTFLEAELGCNPSFTWQSIFNSRPLLMAGLRWRIGDGHTVKIWGDRRLPRGYSFLPISPHSLPNVTRVSFLIDSDRKCWDLGKLQTYFLAADVEVIRKIPISPYLPSDILIWHYT
ncbi:uncharacterized protein LOC114322024 [Camellia sinensis]|uniref:uncharacterized protein LOC114322024 n=1 Tax=Camellia sinensis TaxID=4442 RepID=UPI00103653E0|nr:uncharacterized protein LOC114322024 [Camellia sinensis]